MDFGIQYQIQTQFGVFTSLTQATYLDSFQFAEVPGDTEVELRSGQLRDFFRRGTFEVESQFPPRLGLAQGSIWQQRSIISMAFMKALTSILAFLLTKAYSSITSSKPGSLTFRLPTILFLFRRSKQRRVPGYSRSATSSGDGKSTENAAAQTANFGLPCWKRLLNNTTVTLGCNNVFGHDPPMRSRVRTTRTSFTTRPGDSFTRA